MRTVGRPICVAMLLQKFHVCGGNWSDCTGAKPLLFVLVHRGKRTNTKEGEETLNEIVVWGEEHTLLLLLILATGVGCGWLLLVGKRLKVPQYAVLPIAILHTLIGVLSVEVFAFLETGFNPESLGNMSLFGGIFFMPLAYWAGAKLTKRNTAQVFDIFTICMIFTVMCARINCIFAGCCFGTLIPGLENIRWPTREVEIVFYVVLLIVLGSKVLAGKSHGEIYPIYMISYGALRFVLEFLRFKAGSTSIIHLSHLWALVAFALGLSIYYELRSPQKAKNFRR